MFLYKKKIFVAKAGNWNVDLVHEDSADNSGYGSEGNNQSNQRR